MVSDPNLSVRVSPWARSFVDERDPTNPRFAIFHLLSGSHIHVSRRVRRIAEFLYGRELDGLARPNPTDLSLEQLKRGLTEADRLAIDVLAANRILVAEKDKDERLEAFYSWRPVRCPWVLRFHDRERRAHWLSSGNRGQYAVVELSRAEERFLLSCDGARSLGELATGRLRDPENLRQLLEKLAHPSNQLVRLRREGDAAPLKRLPARQWVGLAPEDAARKQLLTRSGVIDHRRYHQTRIRDAQKQFDRIEITVSHAFRFPSEALGGLSYGAAFFDAVSARFPIRGETKILEVGGGIGVFSREFLSRARRSNLAPRYAILDLSPELQRSQRAINVEAGNRVRFLLGDAEKTRLREPVDLILSNEVIADLRTVRLESAGDPACGKPAVRRAWTLIRELGIDLADAPPQFYFNLGAVEFLRSAYANLSPRGLAVLTEYGSVSAYPKAASHLDHDEYSIHFGHLIKAAQAIGFESVECMDLSSFLPFNQQTEMLNGTVEPLNAILRMLAQAPLPQAAYSKRELKTQLSRLGVRLPKLSFSPFYKARFWGPYPGRFRVLLLRKRKLVNATE